MFLSSTLLQHTELAAHAVEELERTARRALTEGGKGMPSVVQANKVLKMCADDCGNGELAARVMGLLRQTGVAPDRITYNTLLDDYILGNFMFLAVIVLENVIVHYIGRHTADYDGGGEDNDAEESDESSSSSSANQVDSASWKVLAVAFAMLNLAFLVQARGRWQKNQG